MPFCPQCRYEYHEGVQRCPDCDVALVDELPLWGQHAPSQALVTVYVAKDMTEASVIKSFLEEFQIEALIAYDLGSAYPVGPIDVRVAEEHADEARELIAEFLQAPPEDLDL
ncbi:MAG: DUF2007 domain-containing protein [Candidatus Bipolaricaulota bacterium]|nr:DUF2007 domain-containing protein [Candidatus Bipolaricaulota bacterium]MDW8031384.1 DUF2007 domain-containing protein [Candidatus Bipolaricaulota bacterium]